MKAKKGNFLKQFNNFSVSKIAKFSAFAPAIIVLVAVIMIIAIGATSGSYSDAVGIGIDFEGGTLITVTLGQDAVDNYDSNKDSIKETIENHGVTVSYIQLQEANNAEKNAIVFRYKNISKDDNEINATNEAIREDVDALYPELPGNVTFESIGATAASDLLSKAGIALAVSVVLILIYIIIRFTLMSAFAAIIALLHDVVIMFALTVICRVQINSSYVAAMITIIAYSINNTIIIFDRCREYIKPLKGQASIDYANIGDMAVRDTMTRSIYTTFTTMVTVFFLCVLGSDTIREFCVPIILGLVAGFFSSVFLATPLWAAMSKSYDKTRAKYSKRDQVTYSKSAEKAEDPYDNEDHEYRPKEEKQAQVKAKAKANTVYKYTKKNTTFKKKK